MAREDAQFRLRIPDDLRGRLNQASATNDRSLTAEIIARLEASFLVENDGDRGHIPEEVRDLLADIERLKRKVVHALLPQK